MSKNISLGMKLAFPPASCNMFFSTASLLHCLLAILPIISPGAIALNPRFFSVINLLAVKASSRESLDCCSSEHRFLIKFEKLYQGHLMIFQIAWTLIFLTSHQYRGRIVRNLFLLTFLLSLPKIHRTPRM